MVVAQVPKCSPDLANNVVWIALDRALPPVVHSARFTPLERSESSRKRLSVDMQMVGGAHPGMPHVLQADLRQDHDVPIRRRTLIFVRALRFVQLKTPDDAWKRVEAR